MKPLLSLSALCMLGFTVAPAAALEEAPCEDDVSVRPQWVSFQGGPGLRVGAPGATTRLMLAADVAYSVGLSTLSPELVSGLCQYDLDGAVDYLRLGAGYAVSVTDFEQLTSSPHGLLADASWHRILSSSWRASIGAAADYSWFEGDGRAISIGGVARVNFADWVTLSSRVTTPVSAEPFDGGGITALFVLAIEPRLWCEHVSRERCEPSWFLSSLVTGP